ncbi:hypothetical protein UA08_09224 [Talaromyces atroroseus]|uniref:Alpha/beta hydrolase fold-3 domain-containing protein n=1 Tax=Talaromyces atroroseus TaxID=1441469 RepID=A0A1Q5Q6W0_TALAT|nr:hypothetical protein UA08_09224 [Talaromyces atroroseus]OKL55480.1 hypothetical protein UA08_09224 [Talaromyces atroroseus]
MASSLPAPINPKFPLSRLDDDFIEYYNKYLAIKPATHNINVEELKANPQKYASPWARDFSYEPFVNDIQLKSDDGHEFTTRLYRPDPRTSPFGEGPYPIHVNFHEHLFGKGHDDAWAAIQWVHEHGPEIGARPDSISIGGISAGGHISAVCQQLARDAGIDLKLAVIAVPATVTGDGKPDAADSPFPSAVENEFAPCLSWQRLEFFRNIYEPKSEEVKQELNARPVFIRKPLEGNLRGVCDTYIATADCDPLRDEGEEYGQRLVKAGVKVTTRRYTGVPHPFMHMLHIKKGQLYISDICTALKAVHGA